MFHVDITLSSKFTTFFFFAVFIQRNYQKKACCLEVTMKRLGQVNHLTQVIFSDQVVPKVGSGHLRIPWWGFWVLVILVLT